MFYRKYMILKAFRISILITLNAINIFHPNFFFNLVIQNILLLFYHSYHNRKEKINYNNLTNFYLLA